MKDKKKKAPVKKVVSKNNSKKTMKTKKQSKIIRKSLLNNKTFLVIVLLILFVLVFAIYKVVIFIQNSTSTFNVEQGQIYQEERGIGYIIREETIAKGSNYKNGIEQIKTEGERVAKGEAIFRYYSSGEDSLEKKIQDLDVKIEEAMANESQIFNSDIKSLEKQIEDQIASLSQVNDLQTIKETKKEIANNITKKAKIAGDLSPSGSYLKKLINERSNYENKLNEGAEYLTSPISGVVSYKVDGYEDVLTPKDFSNLNTEFLENLNLKTGQVVADSTESAKIINNFECYIACTLNSEQAKVAQIGDIVKLRLPNDTEVSSEIVHLKQENEKILFVFKIDKQVQSLISYRKMSFDIIWWSDSGKKVPNEAIGHETKEGNEIAYIVRTRAGYEDKIWIKKIRANDKYTIVDNYTNTELKELGFTDEELKGRAILSLYDEILKNPT